MSEVILEPRPERSEERRRWAFGLVAIVGLGIFGISSLSRSLVLYTHDFDEVRRREGELLQVPGVIDKTAPETYDLTAGTFSFTMLGVEDPSTSLRVVSYRVKPGNFDEASQVVCRGTYRDGAFHARELLVKCPSKELDKMRTANEASAGGDKP